MADRCGLSHDDVLEAMELGASQRPMSLDGPNRDGQQQGLVPGSVDEALDLVEARSLVTTLMARLPERERRILHLRFSEGLTQSRIAVEIGVSQMYVSRLLTRTLARMRVVAGTA